MNTEASYPYIDEARLSERSAYFYSAYNGVAFLRVWRESRALCGSSAAPPPKPSDDILPTPGGEVETTILLESLFASLSSHRFKEEPVSYWLRQLVKKFEVTGRVHEAYNEKFRALDKAAHKNLELYVRLAEVFAIAYERYDSLDFLNVLLKVNDRLLSKMRYLSSAQRSRLKWCIERERDFVESLAAKMGVGT